MKTIKRFFLLAFSTLFLVNVHNLNAQVTIGGETAPVAGATLDLSPSGGYVGGLKLPNVSLTSITAIPASFTADAASITASNLKGLQVYNTTTDAGLGLAEGVYTWNGNRWTQDGLKQSSVYNITYATTTIVEASTEPVLATFTLAPGLYQWNASLPIFLANGTSVVEKDSYFFLRNKTTGAKLATIHNITVAANYIYAVGSYVFNIDATTIITLSVATSIAGSSALAVDNSENNQHCFSQIVKLN